MDSARDDGGGSPAAASAPPSSSPGGTPVSAAAAAAAKAAAAQQQQQQQQQQQRVPIEAHFDRLRANLIRCEECNESFFFDFLRHPRYFVAHFKACHLKNVLYRFNGLSEEENQRIRFGPRRKKDATAWFSQLKSTEKRMISMQDNQWSEIAEKECWVCRACNAHKEDLAHAYGPDELGQRQALLHLRQAHVAAYDSFLRSLPEAPASAPKATAPGSSELATTLEVAGLAREQPARAGKAAPEPIPPRALPSRPAAESRRVSGQRSSEAERSRLRRMCASPAVRQMEAQRSKKRREKMTPAQRHADAERRKRKQKRLEEAARSKQRRQEASREHKDKETRRSRDRRLQASEDQRQREAQRSRERRRRATDEQKAKERERCRLRYETKKRLTQQWRGAGSASASTDGDDGREAASGAAAGCSRRIKSISPREDAAGASGGEAAASSALHALYASLAEPAASAGRGP